MYLKELTINGFKSFAKKSDFEFSVPITAIVGPNGSGKSNVAESFRFVLGEQSVKSMRGKKGEDLIWGGSEKVARGNRASVELTFDNKHRTFTLDFDEIKIERIVHRDGANEYKLNGSQVRLKDIHELLANANIGSTGHHIISQGEADRILSAGAKERREMIEDALGLKVFQIKKQETNRKLEKTEENIEQVHSLRREAAPHLKYLKKQVEKAERSLEVQAELKQSYAEYLKREDTYIAHHFDRLTMARRIPEETLEALQTSIAEAKEALQDNEDTEAKEALLVVENEYKEASQNRQKVQHELSQLQGQIAFLERRLEHARKSETPTNKLIPHAHLEQLVEDIALQAEKALGRGGEANLGRALTDLIHQLRGFLKKSQGEVIDTTEADREELLQLQGKLMTAEKAVTEALEEEESAEQKVVAKRTEKMTDLESKRAAERSMFELMQQRREKEAEINRIDNELAVLNRDREDFKQELQEAVSLLGRGASDYFTIVIVDEDGQEVSLETIVSEEREVQRGRRRMLEKHKIRLEELGVGNTDDLLLEYQNAKERDEFLERELADLETSVQNLRSLIVDLQQKLEEQFNVGVEKIATEFSRFFALMFGGGSAGLDRVAIKNRQSEDDEESEVQTEEGIELVVSLPNKRVRGLDMLSGGERALTSIALIFAMSQVNPPPFIILDETDAALDEANSRRYGDMIEALAKKSQLILITHNRETMSRAGILYGITMGIDGISKVLSVKFEEAAQNAK
ncbi:MAG: AAA family ATPase [Candidatus Pacebacteria bacterium]|nr:AAA family ATPase [Candidatus Paceibacterota bacterium]